MTNNYQNSMLGIFASVFACLLIIAPTTVSASDVDELTTLLNEFLASADEKPAHERFWADDLVYTSSAGSRTDKAAILASFDTEAATDDEPSLEYSADDIDIRLYGNTAVVAFKLVAVPADDGSDSSEQNYFNTGTFQKRDGEWRAIAWQATRIPDPD